MALRDHMPYGAPDLLAGDADRLARATGLASLTIVAALLVLAPLVGRGVVDQIEIPPLDPSEFLPPLRPSSPPSPGPMPHAPAEPRVDPAAAPFIVPENAPIAEAQAPPELPGGGAGSGSQPAGAEGEASSSVSPCVPAADPDPGVPVFVEEYPALVRSRDPIYPELARAAGAEGVVIVLVLVGLDGRAERAIVRSSTGGPMLDEAAIEAAMSCVFTPALTSGHPVKVWVARTYRFRLH